MERLSEKVAVITGASMGIGAEIAKYFAKEGAKVVATDIQEKPLQQVVKDINDNYGEAIAIKHDVASEADWVDVIQKTVEAYGSLDVLVNNAGIVIMKNAEETTLEEWDKTIGINATGAFLGTKYAIPEMRKAGGGSIINISSISGIVGIGAAAYNASKGAIRAFTKNVAADFAQENIRVNSLHPGVIITPLTHDLLSDPETKANFEALTLLPRLGKSEDIAYGALFLASDESSFMTGSELVIDGGLMSV